MHRIQMLQQLFYSISQIDFQVFWNLCILFMPSENQIVDGMSLFDDDLMSMVFDANIEATELLLKIILKKDDIQVISVVGQRELQSPVVGGRDIRLDILAKDGFGCKEARDMYYPELAKGVRHFKEEGGREKMCEAVEKYAKDYAEEYAENARQNSLLESIKNLMDSMKWSAEQAMVAMKVSEADKAMLLKKL